jgi:hypothetical protein
MENPGHRKAGFPVHPPQLLRSENPESILILAFYFSLGEAIFSWFWCEPPLGGER